MEGWNLAKGTYDLALGFFAHLQVRSVSCISSDSSLLVKKKKSTHAYIYGYATEEKKK